MALGMLVVFTMVALASVVALRSILYSQLDDTLVHIAEVEARHGAATTSSAFAFHEGVLLQPRDDAANELTRYAQLWASNGQPLARSRNLHVDLNLPKDALASAQDGEVGRVTHQWNGQTIRSIVYPLALVGAAHGVHVLQVAAPIRAVRRTLSSFVVLLSALTLLATVGAFLVGWRLAGVALRPTREITDQAEAIEAGTLSERITAHADVQEFGRLVTVLNGMLDRLQAAFEAQRRFIADASHELRAPLNVLRGELDVLLRRDRSIDEYRETAERCRDEVRLMSSLVTNLLVLARGDAGVLVEHRTDVDLHDIAERIASRFRPLAAARGVSIEVTGHPAVLQGDPGLLEQAVSNLVENGMRHAAPDGAVRISVASHDGACTVTVADDGRGVPPPEVPHLFTRFFRGGPARRSSDGAGLGLAIARAAAEAHGGHVAFVGNAPGAVFRVTLPHERQTVVRAPG